MAILAREMGFDWLVLRRGLFEGCVENVRHGTTSSGRGLTYLHAISDVRHIVLCAR